MISRLMKNAHLPFGRLTALCKSKDKAEGRRYPHPSPLIIPYGPPLGSELFEGGYTPLGQVPSAESAWRKSPSPVQAFHEGWRNRLQIFIRKGERTIRKATDKRTIEMR